jgi:hypothetical protein
MVVRFTTTLVPMQSVPITTDVVNLYPAQGAWCTTVCYKVCQRLAEGRWFSPGTPVSSTNKTDRNDITEIWFKVALNTINQTIYQ